MKRLTSFFISVIVASVSIGTMCYASVETVENLEITLDFPYGERTGFYSGELVNRIPEGIGTFKSTNDTGDGCTYEGQWKNGVFDGCGSCLWDNGKFYSGYYKNGEEDGEGTVYQDGIYQYSGIFSGGQLLSLYRDTVNINENEPYQYVQIHDMGFQIPASWTYESLDNGTIHIKMDDYENASILFNEYSDMDISDDTIQEKIKGFYINDYGQYYPRYRLVTEDSSYGMVPEYNFHMTFYSDDDLVDVYVDSFIRSDKTYMTTTVMPGAGNNYYEAAKCIQGTLKGWQYIQQDIATQKLDETRNGIIQSGNWEDIEASCKEVTEQDIIDEIYPEQIVIIEGIINNITEQGFDLWIPHDGSFIHTKYWKFNDWIQSLPPEVTDGSTVKVCVETGKDGHPDTSEKMYAVHPIGSEKVEDIVGKYKQSCKTIDYKAILRNPEKARGSVWKASGKVLQVIETTDTLQKLLLQLEDGNVVYLLYFKEKGCDNILEDDPIIAYGTFYVTETYSTLLNEKKTVPKLSCSYIDLLG